MWGKKLICGARDLYVGKGLICGVRGLYEG